MQSRRRSLRTSSPAGDAPSKGSRPVVPAVVLVLVLLLGVAGCGGASGGGSARSGLTSVGTLAAPSVRPSGVSPRCDLIPSARVSAVLGKPVTDESQYRSLFVLPSIRQIPAEQCAFALTGSSGVTVVNIRTTVKDVKPMFRVLGSYPSPAMSRVTTIATPATQAFWQSIGSTLWAAEGDQRAVAVELVSDTSDPRYQSLALQLALEVLADR